MFYFFISVKNYVEHLFKLSVLYLCNIDIKKIKNDIVHNKQYNKITWSLFIKLYAF